MSGIVPLSIELPRSGSNEIDRAFVVLDRQDSGCLSYGITLGGRRLFVKRSTTAAARRSLLNALRFHETVEHAAIVRPEQASSGDAVTLVYPWVDGSVLNHATLAGSDRSGLSRFRRLPLPIVEQAITTVLDAHAAVARAGFVSVDFYDGAMLYDFDRDEMHLIDLDDYRPGPFEVTGHRLPGSRSYMAPEEWRNRATIDEHTMVFTMGRTIQQLFDSDAGKWRGAPDRKAIAARATAVNPVDRYETIAALIHHWDSRAALS